jgi:hypothetical protein
MLAARPDEAVSECNNDSTLLLVIDLRTPGLDIRDLVGDVTGFNPAPRIAAVAPHVHTESLAAADEAGCDEIFTRGQFDVRLDSLLAELTESGATERSAGS